MSTQVDYLLKLFLNKTTFWRKIMEGHLLLARNQPYTNKYIPSLQNWALGKNLIKQNQVACKLPPCTTDDDHIVKKCFGF